MLRCGLFDGLLLPFARNRLLSFPILLKELKVPVELPVDHFLCSLLLREEVGLPAHEPKERVEEVIDALSLLDHAHKDAVESLFRHNNN